MYALIYPLSSPLPHRRRPLLPLPNVHLKHQYLPSLLIIILLYHIRSKLFASSPFLWIKRHLRSPPVLSARKLRTGSASSYSHHHTTPTPFCVLILPCTVKTAPSARFSSPPPFSYLSLLLVCHTPYPPHPRTNTPLSNSKFWPTRIPRSANRAPPERRRGPRLSRPLHFRSSSFAFGSRCRGVLKGIGWFWDATGSSGTLHALTVFSTIHPGSTRIFIEFT
jgi:hypothetical protein